MNKRGMFFTLIIILLVLVVLITISFPKKYYLRDRSFIIETRITGMDRFIEDLSRDMDRALYIASFRALLGMSQYIASEGHYLPDVDAAFKELMLNETLNGSIFNVTKASGFNNWVARVQQETDALDMDLIVNVNSVHISQLSPWTVDISLETDVSLYDQKALAKWEYGQTATTSIEILEFEDPIYTVESNGTFINTIRESPYFQFVDLATNDTTNLSLLLDESYYIESPKGPSFLMRYGGNFNSSLMGIESLVDVTKIFSPTMKYNKTAVDYIYWSPDDPPSSRIDNMPSTFRLDAAHLDVYNASGLVIPG